MLPRARSGRVGIVSTIGVRWWPYRAGGHITLVALLQRCPYCTGSRIARPWPLVAEDVGRLARRNVYIDTWTQTCVYRHVYVHAYMCECVCIKACVEVRDEPVRSSTPFLFVPLASAGAGP